MVFQMQIIFAFQPQEKKSCALKFLLSSLFLGTHLSAPFLSHPPHVSPSLNQSPTNPPCPPQEADAAASLLPHCLRFCSRGGRGLLAQVFGILLCRLAGQGVGLAGWALADRFAGRLGWVALPAISP